MREVDNNDISMARIAIEFALEDDNHGKPLFTIADLEDIVNNDCRPAQRIVSKLWEINTLKTDEIDKLQKN